MRVFCRLRACVKLFLRRFMLLNAFCKECGREVRDFIAPDEAWEKIKPLIKRGNVLCYECFCDKCREVGIYTTWRLIGE